MASIVEPVKTQPLGRRLMEVSGVGLQPEVPCGCKEFWPDLWWCWR